MEETNEMKLHNRLNNLACRYETLHENYSKILTLWNKEREYSRNMERTIDEQSKLIDTLNERIKMLEGN